MLQLSIALLSRDNYQQWQPLALLSRDNYQQWQPLALFWQTCIFSGKDQLWLLKAFISQILHYYWQCIHSTVVPNVLFACHHHHYVPSVVNRSAVMDLHRSRSCAILIQSLYDIFVHSLMLSVHIFLGLPRSLLPFIFPSISNRCTPFPLIICPKYWHSHVPDAIWGENRTHWLAEVL